MRLEVGSRESTWLLQELCDEILACVKRSEAHISELCSSLSFGLPLTYQPLISLSGLLNALAESFLALPPTGLNKSELLQALLGYPSWTALWGAALMPSLTSTLPMCHRVNRVAAAGVAATRVTSWFTVSHTHAQHWEVFSCTQAQGCWFKASCCSQWLQWTKSKVAKKKMIPFPPR